MKNTTCGGLRLNGATKLFTSFLVILLTACAQSGSENTTGPSQQELLAELERNQLIWSKSGVAEYSFDVTKDCDCPVELKSDITFYVNEADSEKNYVKYNSGGAGNQISARDGDDDDRSTNRINQSPRLETFFVDLRQAILQNSIQQVTYDPTYGFPQTVRVNNAVNIPFNSNTQSFVNINNDFDDDDRISPLTFQTRNFRALQTNNSPTPISLNGQFIRQTNPLTNVADQLWLVDDDGRWNQLNAPANLFAQNNIANQSRVKVRGQRFPGGINGQGFINLQDISPFQNNSIPKNLSGILNYSVLNNDSFDLDKFYVTKDSGVNIFLVITPDLLNQAYGLAGQRVRLSGNWTPNATTPNARFNPSGFTTINTVLQTFTGILTNGSAYPIPGVQQSNFMLIDDFGSMLELQVPLNIANSIMNFVGKRVEIHGTRLNAGGFGQPIISVQGLTEIQNIFTNSQQISGVVSQILPGNGYDNSQRLSVQLNSGSNITVHIPANFANPYNQLTVGMQIQANGAWISNTGFGQGEFQVRSPIQITNLGFTTSTVYSGVISNIGTIGGGLNCNGTQNNYGFTTDTGRQFQLFVNTSTQITGLNGQSLNLPYQARIQVTGTEVSPGVLQAQTITVSPQFETTISGTIIEIGGVGDTFTCTGSINTYRLLDNFGNAYSITTSANSIIQGSLGGFLRIGDQVQARGNMGNNGTTFYASQITTTTAGNTGTPYIPNPTPNANVTSFVGTVTGLDCATSFSDSYHFVDNAGTLYKLNVAVHLRTNLLIDVGTQLQVTGTLVNNELVAQQLTQIQTFADPFIRTPMSGSIIASNASLPTSCAMPVYTYQFQNDNGQIQQLRLTNEAALHLPQPIANGTRITVLSRLQSINPQLIDALEIQYTNGQTFFGGQQPFTGGSTNVLGTITGVGCPNEFYFVDQNGIGYKLQVNNAPTNVFVGIGSKLNVTGQVYGNQLVASNIFADQSQVFFPTPTQVTGSILGLENTETFTCGLTINTYTFQNDNGRTQRLRVANDVSNPLIPHLSAGNRVVISNKLESFDGSTIDALNISLQNFF